MDSHALNEEDQLLVNDFVRMRRTDEGAYRLEVGRVDWPSPAEPILVWKIFRIWQHPPTPETLLRAYKAVQKQPRFFRVCTLCGERQNAGHMYSIEMCQECATRYLGVVY